MHVDPGSEEDADVGRTAPPGTEEGEIPGPHRLPGVEPAAGALLIPGVPGKSDALLGEEQLG